MASKNSPAWMNDLNKLYTNSITTTNDKGKTVKKARPDFLIKTADNKPPLLKDITPLDKGSKFSAKIRFQNLSEIELGALMMMFDLNSAKNAAYKW